MNLKNKFIKRHKYKLKKKQILIIKKKKKLIIQNVFSIIAKKSNWLTSNEIDTIILLLKRNFIKEQYKIKLTANFYLTKKPNESRMGKGKGNINNLIRWIKKGETLINFYNINTNYINIIKKIQQRFSIQTVLINNNEKW